MEGYCSTGQSPQRAVVPVEEEEEEEEDEEEELCKKNVKENVTMYHRKDIYEIHHKGNMLSEPRNVPKEPQGLAECNLSTTLTIGLYIHVLLHGT
jgi:hypothetical protein